MAPAMKSTAREILTVAQAIKALYIDFEGNLGLPPSFIGIRIHDGAEAEFEQVIVEQALVGMLVLSNPTERVGQRLQAA